MEVTVVEKFKGKIELDDELLDKVTGGESLWGSATGTTCPNCNFSGTHKVEVPVVNGSIMLGQAIVYCGNCGVIIN